MEVTQRETGQDQRLPFKFLFGTAERKDALLDFINAVLTDGSEENIIAEITLMDR